VAFYLAIFCPVAFCRWPCDRCMALCLGGLSFGPR